ncbi:PucR family transcriptional regulator [Streptomyces niveiscabiei]|uniref:PucR family transcriptional regulator n=1 Tax=Streptomyces niveiscabiei TaxID=164115 RepID=UPI0029BD194F|nr:PucR family transcriptional regulator [Streptomyces niveiscabiei]MDX3383529.1 PucR family transcriptional regulator [Streptomyces niveiscabiei]
MHGEPSTPPPPPPALSTAPPAVPPTPPVPLAALLTREDLALRQIAGPSDPGTVLYGALTSEMADPYPYLLGGELLLTAGVHIPEATGSGTYFDDYVSRVIAAGGVALGFGVAPVHDTVPRALVAACESYGLPLIEVPERTTFAAVARAVWQLMERARTSELRRVTEAQQSLAAAASRPDPVPAVLRQLAQRTGGRAVLFGPEGAEVAAAGTVSGAAKAGGTSGTGPAPSAGPASSTGVDASLAALAHLVTTRASATATDTDPSTGVHLAAYALGTTGATGLTGKGLTGKGPAGTTATPRRPFALAVASPHRTPADHTITSVAAVLLTLLTDERQSTPETTRTTSLVRLLLGASPTEVAPLLGADRWIVVHARPSHHRATGPGRHSPTPDHRPAAPVPHESHPHPHPASPLTPVDPRAALALASSLGTPLVDLTPDLVRLLLPADQDPYPTPTPHPGWSMGMSAPVTPADWPTADAQAARALARAVATRVPVVRHTARTTLTALISPQDAEAHARTLLAPVAGNPALTETLRTWLSLHGSWDRTAVALGVHRNTVRQRIARCAALLGTDLDDPDVRMELWFALRQPPGGEA